MLNYDIYLLFVHMSSTGKGFNKVSDYLNMFKRVIQEGQAKIFARKSQNIGNFRGYFSKVYTKKSYPTCPI